MPERFITVARTAVVVIPIMFVLAFHAACSTPAALVATDVPLCPDRLWELVAAECPGLDELTCDALASHCAALEEIRR